MYLTARLRMLPVTNSATGVPVRASHPREGPRSFRHSWWAARSLNARLPPSRANPSHGFPRLASMCSIFVLCWLLERKCKPEDQVQGRVLSSKSSRLKRRAGFCSTALNIQIVTICLSHNSAAVPVSQRVNGKGLRSGRNRSALSLNMPQLLAVLTAGTCYW